VDQLDTFLQTVITQEWHFWHDAGEDVAHNMAAKYAEHPALHKLIQAYDTRWMESVGAPIDGSGLLLHNWHKMALPFMV
jgi:2-haloacid dehalogenase